MQIWSGERLFEPYPGLLPDQYLFGVWRTLGCEGMSGQPSRLLPATLSACVGSYGTFEADCLLGSVEGDTLDEAIETHVVGVGVYD